MPATKAFLDTVKQKATSRFSVPGSMDKGMTAYGAIFGVIGSINYFEKADYVRGGFALAESIHGVGDLTHVNKFAKKLANKVVLRSAVDILEEAGGISKAVKTTTKLGHLSPVIGITFDIYSIQDNIRNLIENKNTRNLIENKNTSMAAPYVIN